MGATIVAGLVSGSIYGLLALGIVMVYRGSKVLNFAQAEIGTFGVFVAWELVENRELPWFVGAVVALGVVAGISAAFEALVVRRMTASPRVTVAVATIGLFLLLIAIEIKVWGSGPKFLDGAVAGSAFTLFGFVVSWMQVIGFVVAGAVGLGLNTFLRRTDFGLGVLAAAQDPVAVQMSGISLARVSQFTWITAGILGGIAVLVFEPTVGAFAPGTFSIGASALFVPALAAALIGRLDDLTKAFLGGLGVGVVQAGVSRAFAGSSIQGAASIALFILIVGVLLLRAPSLTSTQEATA